MCRAPRRASPCTRSGPSQNPFLSFALPPTSTLISHAFATGSFRVGLLPRLGERSNSQHEEENQSEYRTSKVAVAHSDRAPGRAGPTRCQLRGTILQPGKSMRSAAAPVLPSSASAHTPKRKSTTSTQGTGLRDLMLRLSPWDLL